MSSPEGRRGLDWSQLLATAIGGLIAIIAAFSTEYWKAHMDAHMDDQASQRATSRLAHGSVRAWRDDLYFLALQPPEMVH